MSIAATTSKPAGRKAARPEKNTSTSPVTPATATAGASAGTTTPAPAVSGALPAEPVPPERATLLLERTVTLYEKTFGDIPEGREYLEQLGITDAGLFGPYRIGCSNGSLPSLLPSDGRTRDQLTQIGVLLPNGRERFANSIIFPVYGTEGDLLTITALPMASDQQPSRGSAPRTPPGGVPPPGPGNVSATTAAEPAAAAVPPGDTPETPGRVDAGLVSRGLGDHPDGAPLAATLRGCQQDTVPGAGGGTPPAGGAGAEPPHGCSPFPSPCLFLPDRRPGVWNLTAARTYDDLVVTGSVLDALSVMMAGQRNVIAVLDPAGFAAADIEEIRGYSVRRLTLLLPGDELGHQAVPRLQSLLAPHFICGVRTLLENHTANSFLRANGAAALGAFLADTPPTVQQAPASEGLFSANPAPTAASEAEDTEKPDSRVREDGAAGFSVIYGVRRYQVLALDKDARKLKVTLRVTHGGKLYTDTMDLYSARARRGLCQELCRIVEQPAAGVEADITRLVCACESFNPGRGHAEIPAAPRAETMSPAERQAAEAFGKSPDLVERIVADFEACGLVGENAKTLLGYLAMTSRRMPEPLAVLILSSSGAGKSALQDATLAFCPEEDVVKLTSLTGKALFYKDETSLMHRVLALEEGGGAEGAAYAIRNLISARELVIETTIKDSVTGRMTTMANRVKGPTAVFYTVTNPEVDAETRSRFWVIGLDESREQTQRILEFQRRRQTLSGLCGSVAANPLVRLHRNFQRLLRPLAVVNPYAASLDYGDTRLQARRDQPKYLNLIRAVAFVRQMQKQVRSWNGSGRSIEYVEADPADITLANRLTSELLGTTLDELSIPARDLLDQLLAYTREKGGVPEPVAGEAPKALVRVTFTRRDIREYTGWGATRLRVHLGELVEAEYVALDTVRTNGLRQYRLLYNGEGRDGSRFVLGLRDVPESAHRPVPEAAALADAAASTPDMTLHPLAGG